MNQSGISPIKHEEIKVSIKKREELQSAQPEEVKNTQPDCSLSSIRSEDQLGFDEKFFKPRPRD